MAVARTAAGAAGAPAAPPPRPGPPMRGLTRPVPGQGGQARPWSVTSHRRGRIHAHATQPAKGFARSPPASTSPPTTPTSGPVQPAAAAIPAALTPLESWAAAAGVVFPKVRVAEFGGTKAREGGGDAAAGSTSPGGGRARPSPPPSSPLSLSLSLSLSLRPARPGRHRPDRGWGDHRHPARLGRPARPPQGPVPAAGGLVHRRALAGRALVCQDGPPHP